MKGYQVVELDCLNEMISNDMSISIMYFLLENIRNNRLFENVDLEIIKVTYLGSYPAIGIHYKDPCNKMDYEQDVQKACNHIIQQFKVEDFIYFIINNRQNIDKEIFNYSKE